MASGVIKQPSTQCNSSNPLKFALINADYTNAYIQNGKILLASYRNPILCCFATQQGATVVFVLWSGQTQGAWTLNVVNIVNAASITAALDGNDIKFTGIGNWGQGYAIGL